MGIVRQLLLAELLIWNRKECLN